MSSEARLPPDSLDAIEAEAWALLEAGGGSFRAPFHAGTLGTIGGDGPNLRTVILRGADGASRRIWCHTDIRSPKIAELAADCRIAWTLYDEASRLQFRAWGRAIVHHDDDIARARWETTVLNSRRIYHAVAPPSSISPIATGGLPPELDDERWTPEYSEHGAANFVALETRITRLEALYLHHAGHRRALFRYGDDGTRLAADWLIP
ncbi:pyridoxamine 5'-phosphate oxidase family protein [Nevskia ramosa]|uniref:pyridoxamine 5'-phosphate oxidase family protein n=1 Tax=Nevskia ramosa TaxID=64002 RepID=UPI0003B37B45|nr:pyridoxamine 5'-phosphate oxidase family protein [Nevskia ramosa]